MKTVSLLNTQKNFWCDALLHPLVRINTPKRGYSSWASLGWQWQIVPVSVGDGPKNSRSQTHSGLDFRETKPVLPDRCMFVWLPHMPCTLQNQWHLDVSKYLLKQMAKWPSEDSCYFLNTISNKTFLRIKITCQDVLRCQKEEKKYCVASLSWE